MTAAAAALAAPAGGSTRGACGGTLSGARVVRLRPGTPSPLVLTVLGTGPRGVVLSDESDEDLCSWAPFARRLARSGFRVALYDYSGKGPVADAVSAAAELRRLGARSVALVGASEGAKASIVAAPATKAAAVVSLSAERFLAGFGDVEPAARRLRAPVLYLYGKGDPLAGSATPQLYRASAGEKRLVALSGSGHGTALLRVRGVAATITSFLARHPASIRPRVPPPPALASRCAQRGAGGTTFWFGAADGERLDGALVGTGPTGVVLANEYPSDLCRWLPEALVLRRRGFRVLLFDFRGFGLSPLPAAARRRFDYVQDVVGAARELRARGASRVYLMGASLGGTASIVAAARIEPRVAGVVSLSGEADLSGVFPNSRLSAVAAARTLHVPVLYLATRDDGLTPPADVTRMRRALRFPGSRVVVFPGSYHGWILLYQSPYAARVAALIHRFVRR